MDPTAIRKLLTEAHACMRACGWQLATAGDPQSDGVLEAACSDVEERMGEYLSAPDPRDATIAAIEAVEAAAPPEAWQDTVRDLFDACQFGLPTHTWIIKFIAMRHPEYFCASAAPKETNNV